jgi:transcriptional regulator with XRE-family HTH domain
MTKINKYDEDLVMMGKEIKSIRLALSLRRNSRNFFLNDRINKGLLEEGQISEKTLTNIENGHNLPNLVTLKYLSVSLEMDFIELIRRIENNIPTRNCRNED